MDFPTMVLALFLQKVPQPVDQQEVYCMAEAVYFEARGETIEGQVAVAQVIMNRLASPEFPKTVCGVVRDPGQFTYRRAKIADAEGWMSAVRISTFVYLGWISDFSRGAKYFASKPNAWFRQLTYLGRIGGHHFYDDAS